MTSRTLLLRCRAVRYVKLGLGHGPLAPGLPLHADTKNVPLPLWEIHHNLALLHTLNTLPPAASAPMTFLRHANWKFSRSVMWASLNPNVAWRVSTSKVRVCRSGSLMGKLTCRQTPHPPYLSDSNESWATNIFYSFGWRMAFLQTIQFLCSAR